MMMSAYHSGLVMLTAPVTMMIFSPVGGDLSDKKGTKLPAVLGLSLIIFSCLGTAFFHQGQNLFLRDCSTGLYGRGKWAQCVGHQQLYIGVSGHQHVGEQHQEPWLP